MNKHKYFLRGFGTALIIAAAIFYIANDKSGNISLSDQDIMEKAKTLGMVEASNMQKQEVSDIEVIRLAKEQGMVFEKDVKDALEAKLRESLTHEIKKELEKSQESESTDAAKTEEVASQDTKKDNVDGAKKEEEVNNTETSEEVTGEEQDGPTQVELTISYGMSSQDVATLLYNHGVVDDIRQFDRYLMVHDYAHKIKTGTFTFNVNSTYKEAMKIFTN